MSKAISTKELVVNSLTDMMQSLDPFRFPIMGIMVYLDNKRYFTIGFDMSMSRDTKIQIMRIRVNGENFPVPCVVHNLLLEFPIEVYANRNECLIKVSLLNAENPFVGIETYDAMDIAREKAGWLPLISSAKEK